MADCGVSVTRRVDALSAARGRAGGGGERGASARRGSMSRAEYCRELQEWMWQYYCGYCSWQSWAAVSALSLPACFPAAAGAPAPPTWGADLPAGVAALPGQLSAVTHAGSAGYRGGGGGSTTPVQPVQHHQQQQQNGNAPQPGREYFIPSPLQRFLAEMVDFFILFFIKATIVLSIIHLSGMRDLSRFAMHFIVEEIDEDTSMEDLQKMMLVALVYRILVCFYEVVCIWGAGGATPGKFLLGLKVVTCDTSVLVQPNRVRVVPATDVSLSASTVRALNKNFSIVFFFPAFITLLFFQHNRTVYDIVAGTIVVKRNRPR
ncbi:protein FAM8A1-like [Astyanax mexicanus]|uniref:Protein FAM8A1-like n=1 Tax=Astyanax mexicanus TaxID=7994 RepID=A0A8T2M4N1_ASTMX|nr:protein FAM8A1-like [Astyanax mexicanus]